MVEARNNLVDSNWLSWAVLSPIRLFTSIQVLCFHSPFELFTQNHWNSELLRSERTSWDHLVQPCPCSSRVSYSRLLSTRSSQALNISKDADSTTSLSNLFLVLMSHTVKMCFLVFILNLVCFDLCHLPLVLSHDTTEKTLVPPPSFQPIR